MINVGTKVTIKPRTYLYKNLAGVVGTVVGSYVANSNTCYSERVNFIKFDGISECLEQSLSNQLNNVKGENQNEYHKLNN